MEDNGRRGDLAESMGLAADRVDWLDCRRGIGSRMWSTWRAAKVSQRPDLSTGDGVYKSTDAGKTWTHLPGLRDGQQIGQVAIDPKDVNKVFVAVTGHPYGPNEERGLYRSVDGGATFKRVLFVNDRTGASEVQIDPQHPNVIYAGMWQRQEAPWENGSWIGAEGGFYRSTDGGDSWTKLTGHGLPDDILQVQVAIAPSDPKRIYAEVAYGAGARTPYAQRRWRRELGARSGG